MKTYAEMEDTINQAMALPNKTKSERQTLATCTNKGATWTQAYGAAAQVLKDRKAIAEAI